MSVVFSSAAVREGESDPPVGSGQQRSLKLKSPGVQSFILGLFRRCPPSSGSSTYSQVLRTSGPGVMAPDPKYGS